MYLGDEKSKTLTGTSAPTQGLFESSATYLNKPEYERDTYADRVSPTEAEKEKLAHKSAILKVLLRELRESEEFSSGNMVSVSF